MLPDSEETELKNTVLRYIDDNGWGWGIALRIIKRQFAVDLTDKELREIYRRAKEEFDD